MENINGVDIFVGLTLLLSALLSYSRGFASEMLGIGSWLISSIATIYGVPFVTPYIELYFTNPIIANILSGIIVFFVCLVFLTVICSKITLKVRKSVLNKLDHVLGLLFGVVRGLVLLVLGYLLITVIAPKSIKELEKDSKSMPYLEKVATNVKDQIPQSLYETKFGIKGLEEKPQDLLALMKLLNAKKDDTSQDELKKEIETMVKALKEQAPSVVEKKKSDPQLEQIKKEIEKLPKNDPLRLMLEESIKSPAKNVDFFEMLNAPEVKAKNKKAKQGYEKKEREDLNRLIMEAADDSSN